MNKTIRSLFIVLMIASMGCSEIWVRKDPSERFVYAGIAAMASSTIQYCAYPSLVRMNLPSLEFMAEQAKVYSYSDSSDDIKEGATILSEMIAEAVERYDLQAPLEGRQQKEPSKMYCEMKFKNINIGATKMFEALKGASS